MALEFQVEISDDSFSEDKKDSARMFENVRGSRTFDGFSGVQELPNRFVPLCVGTCTVPQPPSASVLLIARNGGVHVVFLVPLQVAVLKTAKNGANRKCADLTRKVASLQAELELSEQRLHTAKLTVQVSGRLRCAFARL